MTKNSKSRIKLSDVEKSWRSQVYELVGADVPFWILESGTSAGWPRQLLQRAVNHFHNRILFVQVGADAHPELQLEGTLDLRGQTDSRQLARLVYHAQGVVLRTAKLAKLAAALESKNRARRPRARVMLGQGQVLERIKSWLGRGPGKPLTRTQSAMVRLALEEQRKRKVAVPASTRSGMSEWAFAAACDGLYYPGLKALCNSIAAYHGREIPLFLYHRGLNEEQLRELRGHRVPVHFFKVSELPFPCPGMWEAKQQIPAHAIGRARCVYLLDVDLVLVSAVRDIFELASSGKVVSSQDGPPVVYDAEYAAYHLELPGASQAYINSGALCLDVVRHWDLAALWAFSAQYGAYTKGGGLPLRLPGHGDQGMLNAIAGLLRKSSSFHVLPEGTWCDSTKGCTLAIRRKFKDGRITVWNETENAHQRLVHASGPKWWTSKGASYLRRFGDKLRCFKHFADLKPNSSERRRTKAAAHLSGGKAKAHILVGVCSCAGAEARRAGIRGTWFKRLPREMMAVFLMGAGSARREADVVRLPVQDEYSTLPQKVQAFCRHALEHYEFEYLFKCDDDTYVCAERLLVLAQTGAEYVGSAAWAAQGYASGGAGYLVSRKAVVILAKARFPGCGAEDVWVGEVLRENGIALNPTSLLQMDHQNLPNPQNELITAHWCSPELMGIIEQGFLAPGSTDAVAAFSARHPHWQGPLKLLRNGSFLCRGNEPHGHWKFSNKGESLVLEWFQWPKEVLRRTRWGYLGANLRLELAQPSLSLTPQAHGAGR